MRKFADLEPRHPPAPHWQEQRGRVKQRVQALDAEPIVAGIVSAVQSAFDAGDPLPTVDDIGKTLPDLPEALRPPSDVSSYSDPIARGVVARLTNAALARFLAAAQLDLKRISAVARLEHDVDW